MITPRSRFRFPPSWASLLAVPGLLFAATSLGAASDPADSGDTTETRLEQALALAAERVQLPRELAARPENQRPPLPPAGPLFVGVSDSAVPAYRILPASGEWTVAFDGYAVWGAAYDPATPRVFFNNGASLYVWPLDGSVTLLGTIHDAAEAPMSVVGLAYRSGHLLASRNVANEGIYQIDLATLEATMLYDYADDELDLGGLAVDLRNNHLLATNDDPTPHGTGLFRISNSVDFTKLADYPAGQSDIDGLAVGVGKAYLVTDRPGSIYVYDLVDTEYLPPIAAPWTSLETFSAGAWIALEIFTSDFDHFPPFWSEAGADPCSGHCEDITPEGCWCDADCVQKFDCCIDACDTCGHC